MFTNTPQYKTLHLMIIKGRSSVAATGCIHITKLRTVFPNSNLLSSFKVQLTFSISIYKITELLRALSLVDKCV